MVTITIKNIYLNTTNKQDKVNAAMDYLESLNLHYDTKNAGVHIYFYIEEYRFDLWASIEKLWVTNTDTKRKLIIQGTKEIIEKIEEFYYV
jgi:hypothetical protein